MPRCAGLFGNARSRCANTARCRNGSIVFVSRSNTQFRRSTAAKRSQKIWRWRASFAIVTKGQISPGSILSPRQSSPHLTPGTILLKIVSPQAGPVYAGFHPGSLERQQQTELGQNPNAANDPERFLGVEMFAGSPLTDKLSGLEVEYMLALIYSHEAGKREATIGFDVEQAIRIWAFAAKRPCCSTCCQPWP